MSGTYRLHNYDSKFDDYLLSLDIPRHAIGMIRASKEMITVTEPTQGNPNWTLTMRTGAKSLCAFFICSIIKWCQEKIQLWTFINLCLIKLWCREFADWISSRPKAIEDESPKNSRQAEENNVLVREVFFHRHKFILEIWNRKSRTLAKSAFLCFQMILRISIYVLINHR